MSRNFLITVFPNDNPDENGETHDALNPEEWEDVRYFVWQLESAPSTGKVHYQCYLETTIQKHFSQIKKFAGLEEAHVETRKGTREQARAYCQKTESRIDGPWEYGTWLPNGQGNRSDLAALVNAVKEGKSDREIVEAMPSNYMRHYKAVDRLRMLYSKSRDFKTRVIFIHGAPGVGKSKLAAEILPSAYWKQPHSIWWDGYEGSDVVIDDFKGWLPYADLLRIMDRYPLQTQIKGGQVNFAPKVLIITSSVSPFTWYKPEVHFKWEEFARRVDKWIHFQEKDSHEEISENDAFQLFSQ